MGLFGFGKKQELPKPAQPKDITFQYEQKMTTLVLKLQKRQQFLDTRPMSAAVKEVMFQDMLKSLGNNINARGSWEAGAAEFLKGFGLTEADLDNPRRQS